MHRLARRAALPLGACAVLPTSRPRAEERAPAVQRRLTAVADLAIEAQLFQPAVPWPQWDCNWDHRELDSRGRRRSLLKPSGAPRRHLILIRHGQYDESAGDDSGRVLTALGKRQAVQAGKRVAELLSQPGAVCRGVHSSRLARAVETADLIHAQLNNVPRLPGDPQLNEGVPCHAIPDGVHHAAAVYRDGARIEAAFRKYFKRALPWDEIDDDDGKYLGVPLCRGASSPGMMEVGGLFFDFGAVRTDLTEMLHAGLPGVRQGRGRGGTCLRLLRGEGDEG